MKPLPCLGREDVKEKRKTKGKEKEKKNVREIKKKGEKRNYRDEEHRSHMSLMELG
jgi:hypothetical protein